MSGKIITKPIEWRPFDVKGKIDKEDDEEEEDEPVEPEEDWIRVSCPKCGCRFHKCLKVSP